MLEVFERKNYFVDKWWTKKNQLEISELKIRPLVKMYVLTRVFKIAQKHAIPY